MFNPKHQVLYRNKESATDSFGIHCKKLLKEAKIDVGEIAINSMPDVPIWDSKPVTVDFTLSEFDKSSTIFESQLNELRQKYSDFCHLYTDGSKVERKVASAYVRTVVRWDPILLWVQLRSVHCTCLPIRPCISGWRRFVKYNIRQSSGASTVRVLAGSFVTGDQHWFGKHRLLVWIMI